MDSVEVWLEDKLQSTHPLWIRRLWTSEGEESPPERNHSSSGASLPGKEKLHLQTYKSFGDVIHSGFRLVTW